MADSPPIIQTPRQFPPGCGPSAPISPWPRPQKPSPKPPLSPAKKSQRDIVLDALQTFRARFCEIQASNPTTKRPDMEAWKSLKRNLRIKTAKSPGPVPGVEVGDRFNYRAELVIAGVHTKLQNGIDYAMLRGRLIATCIVAREGYSDKMTDPDFLVYEGEGGFSAQFKVEQVMRAGNLALKNSYEVGNEVRVVRGVKSRSDGSVVYVYDGVYEVVEWRRKKNRKGFMVFEFDLRRKTGQKAIDWKRI